MAKKSLRILCGILTILPLLAAGCTAKKPTASAPLDLAKAFPAANAIPGWDISQKMETYQHENLFSLVDGQADSFFAYGFEQVAVQRYQNSAGTLLNVEVWQLATPADAYGLFSSARSGSPVSIGNEGDADPGRRLAFWQGRAFISLNATQPVPDATLQRFGQAISASLPIGGSRPALVSRLPRTPAEGQAVIFFHEEISIQMEVWLGGENILGLNQATDGVVARYPLGNGTARLVLVQYSTSSQAVKGLKALQNANLPDLLASDAHGDLLGAVIGKVPIDQAQALLQEALK